MLQMKNRKLKFGLAVGGVVVLGVAVPLVRGGGGRWQTRDRCETRLREGGCWQELSFLSSLNT